MKRVIIATLMAIGAAAGTTTQDPSSLHVADAPPNSIWVDSLDLSKAMIRRPRMPRGQTAPPAPMVFKLGGVVYQHAVPLQSNADLAIDLDGQAVRFVSIVGIDDDRQPGQGSVTFEIWVDGKKAADSGVMKGGDAPKPLRVDLTGAKRMIFLSGENARSQQRCAVSPFAQCSKKSVMWNVFTKLIARDATL